MNDLISGGTPDYLSLLRLQGRGFVVLGAGQGIGEQATHALAQAGARLLCVDRDEELARQIADAVGGVPCVADVTSRAEMQRVFDTARQHFGRVHGMVDIIGVAGIKALSAVDDAGWEQQFDIVLRHAFLAIQIGGEMMAADGGGSMAFVGSMSGNRAVPNQSAYATSKAALHHLVRCAGVEYAGRGVRVNAVAPGYVRTPRLNERLDEDAWNAIGKVIPIGRPATPAEIAGPLLFLASDLSAHITGEVIAVDGGAGSVAAFPDVKFAASKTPTP
ncbi:NAD(P)-dependent dehydrogenase (short-subunit alcohol dehydrogenase family) [Acidovorax sp. 100]|uniref:SDR family NAD(P)-dependent oxidoreductase n=1 Tax=Acidovorax sp. 100 TaxID=2135635 RepID=UPI000EF9839E|nr:SDR family oxidoreductase [Acidovorax sp. 100]RMA59953.1 NAD(P)-dependent dehydrogenase (short-subunit alcohol dehydrogenase family) [Acidovorax sp. 100]